MKRIILTTISAFIILSGTLNAQINLGNIKTPNKDQAAGLVKDQLKKMVEKSRGEYSVTDFNYAVSFSDNSGSFETEEKFKKYKRFMFDSMDPAKTGAKSADEKARSYMDAGEMFYASTKYRSAEVSFLEAKKQFQAAGSESTAEYCKLLSNLGLLYHTTGRYSTAQVYSEESFRKRAEINDNTGLAASYNNLAVLYKDQGNYNDAETYIVKAVETAKVSPGEKAPAYAIILNNQAIIYQATGRYKEAETILLKALSVASEELKEKSPSYIKMKVNLALLYQLLGRYDEAETIYLEAIEMKKKRLGTGHPDYAVMLRNIASLYMLKGETEKAGENLQQAVKIYKKQFGEEHPIYAKSLNELGNYYLYLGKTEEARKPVVDAVAISKKTLGEHHPSYTDALESMAIMHWQSKEYTQAAALYKNVMQEYLYQVKTYFPPMSEAEKTMFWEKLQPKFIRFYSFATEAKGAVSELAADMYDYHIATKALLLNSSVKMRNSIANSGNKDLIAKYDQWTDAKDYISRLYSLSREELIEEHINLDSLEKVANGLEKELSQMSDIFSQGVGSKPIGNAEVRGALTGNEAALEIVRFRKYEGMKVTDEVCYAAIVNGSGMAKPAITVLPDGIKMETDWAKEYRKAMQDGATGNEYYGYYWKSIEALCNDFNTLYVSVDGIYNQINLNTILLPSGKYLLDVKKLSLVANTKDVLTLKSAVVKTPKGNAVLFGDPAYSEGLSEDNMTVSSLPGTRIEVDAVEKMMKAAGWKTQKYLGSEAEEEKVKMISGATVLHIATHGFFLEDVWSDTEKIFGIEPVKAAANPLLRSGLLFRGADKTIQNYETPKGKEDGILNAYEAMLLNLENTDMVILSACETGLGKIMNGEGVYGLQRALQVAGANTILISLWQVSDEGTMMLMSGFYKYWLAGKSKAEAFRLAQEELKAKFPEPFYWGAFIMMSK
ncbi:MAG: CHAT domain-containing protein [Bacteroidetes bacterium]|nr:CHAT domain-containing protein [Bacteroidota bacterium]MBU1720954.1 CHAT domain-containing protein [Bacteroidota bacterium]